MKNIERKVHVIDADGQKVGRLATQIAKLLTGKHKPAYVPHHDLGDIVQVLNADKLSITVKKQDQKKYYSYSGYQGGLKVKTLKDVFANNPTEVIRECVFQMLPDNKLRKPRIKRLQFK